MRNKILAVALVAIALSGVLSLFWYQELVYRLPTPIPKDFVSVATGHRIQLPANVRLPGSKPVLLHFFNPECPCSRFNIKYFLTLVKHHGKDIRFMAVVPGNEDLAAAREMLGGEVPVLPDSGQQLSRRCGVYASPQAVLLDAQGVLYYRGNYNRSRYCNQKKTSYAEIAIESLLARNPSPGFDALATRAYGCQLPGRE